MYLSGDNFFLILEKLNASGINKLCKLNKKINKFCKNPNNKNYISKIILKNEYNFEYFPHNYPYNSIHRFLKNIHYGESKNINKALLHTIEMAPKRNKLQIIKFLIKNGANNINEALNITYNEEIKNYLNTQLQVGGDYYEDYNELEKRIYYAKNNIPFTLDMISNAMIKYRELYDNVSESSDYNYLKKMIKKVLESEEINEEIQGQMEIIDKEIKKLLDFAFMEEDFQKFALI